MTIIGSDDEYSDWKRSRPLDKQIKAHHYSVINMKHRDEGCVMMNAMTSPSNHPPVLCFDFSQHPSVHHRHVLRDHLSGV